MNVIKSGQKLMGAISKRNSQHKPGSIPTKTTAPGIHSSRESRTNSPNQQESNYFPKENQQHLIKQKSTVKEMISKYRQKQISEADLIDITKRFAQDSLDNCKQVINSLKAVKKENLKLDKEIYDLAQISFDLAGQSLGLALNKYIEAGNWLEAVTQYNRMKKVGVKPDVNIYNKILLACSKAGQNDVASEIFNDMQKDKIPANAATYNKLISANGKKGDWKKAFEYFYEMEKHGITADIISFNSLITALGKGGHWDLAVEAFSEFRQSSRRLDAIIYGTLITACMENGQPQVALKFLKNAIDDGMYKKNLGYDSNLNQINFHIDAVYSQTTTEGHIPGVPLPVAQAITLYHKDKINPDLKLIVGYHGKDTLKTGMSEFIYKEFGLYKAEQDPDNRGALLISRK